MKNLKTSREKVAQKSKSGFTVVELTLTMSFVAVLLITIAIVTSNIVTIYQKGLTLKAVNSVGRSLIDEFTSAVNSAPTLDVTSLCDNLARDNAAKCKDEHAGLYVFQSKSGEARDSQGRELAAQPVQYYGVFCTGRYSYIWNTYYGIASGHTLKVTYLDKENNQHTIPASDQDPAPRLLRFEDSTRRVCSAVTSRTYESTLDPTRSQTEINITELANSTAELKLPNPVPHPETNLLNEFDLDLMLYELTMFPPSQDAVTNRTFLSGTFVLATERGNVDITRTGDYCNINDATLLENGENEGSGSVLDIGSEFNYCAINKFNFAARTAGVQQL